MKLVLQKDEYGCVPACLAMVTGKTYEEVAADFENDFSKSGIDLEHTLTYLGDYGYQVLEKRVCSYNNKNFARAEMFKPFAPIHILRVIAKVDSKNGHVVVMTKQGKILCPGGWSDDGIRKAYFASTCLGIFT